MRGVTYEGSNCERGGTGVDWGGGGGGGGGGGRERERERENHLLITLGPCSGCK